MTSSLLFLIALAFAVAPPVSPPSPSRLHFEGLDRLYFARVGGAEGLRAPANVSAFLPLLIARSAPLPDEKTFPGISVTDIPLPVQDWPQSVVLRQVVLSGARIDEQWLALYDGGRRSDVWHFQARPDLTDNKLLPNYSVGGARAGAGETVVLDLGGSMFRPQGGWWVNQKEVTLAVRGDTLVLQHVRGTYGFIHDYDRGADLPAFSVMVERAVDGRFERRELYPVSVAAIKACGADVENDYIEAGPDGLQTVAECVTRDPRSKVTWRRLDEPSFAERGYKAPPPD